MTEAALASTSLGSTRALSSGALTGRLKVEETAPAMELVMDAASGKPMEAYWALPLVVTLVQQRDTCSEAWSVQMMASGSEQTRAPPTGRLTAMPRVSPRVHRCDGCTLQGEPRASRCSRPPR